MRLLQRRQWSVRQFLHLVHSCNILCRYLAAHDPDGSHKVFSASSGTSASSTPTLSFEITTLAPGAGHSTTPLDVRYSNFNQIQVPWFFSESPFNPAVAKTSRCTLPQAALTSSSLCSKVTGSTPLRFTGAICALVAVACAVRSILHASPLSLFYAVTNVDMLSNARIYLLTLLSPTATSRSWSIPHASWTQKGYIDKRADTPPWLFNVSTWVNSHWQPLDIFNISGGDPDVIAPRVLDMVARFNLSQPLGLHWCVRLRQFWDMFAFCFCLLSSEFVKERQLYSHATHILICFDGA
jgi:hypothetical protein